jgi:hypothetical protein
LKKILTLTAYLFHPLFIPFLGTVFYLFFNDNYFETFDKYLILVQIILITILIPISFIYLLKIIGKVDSIMVSEVSQRKIPLAIQLFLIVLLLVKSITIDRVPELFFFFFGGLMSTFLAFSFLFLKVKASIHMMGISSLTVFVIGLSIHQHTNLLPLIAFLIFINGMVASSRLIMKAHTRNELVLGFILGVLPQIGLLSFWL